MEKKTLLKHLNEDLAAELGAIIQYLTYAAKATGPYRPQLAHATPELQKLLLLRGSIRCTACFW